MSFVEELQALLPADLPNRGSCVVGAAQHLAMVMEANEQFNLTRIVSPREAAIKHVVDSITPWHLFAEAKQVVDAGSGPGFPGIPLALVLPQVQFCLLESTQKKARFISSVIDALGLRNVRVFPERVETWIKTQSPDMVTARALAPLHKAVPWFAPALRRGARVVLYKGPEAEAQIEEARKMAGSRGYSFRVIFEYELADEMGSRCMVDLDAL